MHVRYHTGMNKAYTLTLNRAHKIVERLSQSAKETKQALVLQSSSVRVNHAGDQSGMKKAASYKTQVLGTLHQYTDLMTAVSAVRKTIMQANDQEGISSLLVTQSTKSQLLATLREMVASADAESAIDAKDVPEKTGDTYTSYQVATLTNDEIEDIKNQISNLQRAVNVLADEIAVKNQIRVTIELPDEMAALAGL